MCYEILVNGTILEYINTSSIPIINSYFIPFNRGPLKELILSNIHSTRLFLQRGVVSSSSFTSLNLEKISDFIFSYPFNIFAVTLCVYFALSFQA